MCPVPPFRRNPFKRGGKNALKASMSRHTVLLSSTHRDYFPPFLCQIVLPETVHLDQFAAIIGVHPERPAVRLRTRPARRCVNGGFSGHAGGGRRRVICLSIKLNLGVSRSLPPTVRYPTRSLLVHG